MWNEIVSQEDINSFMELLGGFHDGCIKEFKYISGAFVQENLSMHPFNRKRKLKMIIQRQYRDPSVIEMEFGGLIQLQVFPMDENRGDCIIFGATMLKGDGYIYWCDDENLSENDLDSYGGTLICSESVRWRAVDEYIGEEEVYVNR